MDYFKELEMFNQLPVIDDQGVHGTPVNVADVQTFGSENVLGQCNYIQHDGNFTIQPWYYYSYPTKSAVSKCKTKFLRR